MQPPNTSDPRVGGGYLAPDEMDALLAPAVAGMGGPSLWWSLVRLTPDMPAERWIDVLRDQILYGALGDRMTLSQRCQVSTYLKAAERACKQAE